MRTLRSSAFIVALICLGSACKEGDVDGFDGSFFADEDAGAQAHDDAAVPDDEDAGAVAQDAGASDAGPAVTPPTLAEIPTELAKAACEALTACRGAELLSDFLNGQDCVTGRAYRQEDGDQHELAQSVSEGRVVFKAGAFAKCASDIAALGCDAQTYRWSDSCESALSGTVALGGDCDIDLDCKGRAYCKKGSACPGVCTALVEQGAACTGNSECADGLACIGGTSCEPLGVDGDSCEVGEPPCGIGFVCHTEAGGKLCRELSSVYTGNKNAPCTATGNLCKPELVCASSSGSMGVCEARAASGGACKRAQPNQCPMDEYCDATTAGMAGLCSEYPGDGETCLGRSQPCASGTVCVAGVCQSLLRLGDACSDDAECYSGTCDSVCVVSAMTCSF